MARGLDDVDKVMCGVLDSELDKRVIAGGFNHRK